jgi:hypothetical protein
MIVTSWVLLVMFAVIGLTFLRKMFVGRLNRLELFLMLLSIVVSALSAGVIFGGLLK